MSKPDLQSIIDGLKLEVSNRSAFQSAFATCRRIAGIYIKKGSGSLNIGKFLNKNLDDLSFEIIEPLFLKNQNDGKLEIARSFEHLKITNSIRKPS